MPLWKIVPNATADDPRWLDFPRWQEVIVRADTAGEAVLNAANELGRQRRQVGNESPTNATGLEDEKLYTVHRLDVDDTPGDTAGVLRAVPGDLP